MPQPRITRAITRLERLRAVEGFAELSRRTGTAVGHFSRLLSGQRTLTPRMLDIILSRTSTKVLSDKLQEAGFTHNESVDVARLKSPETFSTKVSGKGIRVYPAGQSAKITTKIIKTDHTEAAIVLRRLKEQRGLSEASRSLGLSRSALSAYTSGRRVITDRAAEKILSGYVLGTLSLKIEAKGFTPTEASRIMDLSGPGYKRVLKAREKLLEKHQTIYNTTKKEEKDMTAEIISLVGRRRVNEFNAFIAEQSKVYNKSKRIERIIMRNWIEKAGSAAAVAAKMRVYKGKRRK